MIIAVAAAESHFSVVCSRSLRQQTVNHSVMCYSGTLHGLVTKNAL